MRVIHRWIVWKAFLWYDLMMFRELYLTHRDQDKVAAILQTTSWNAFSWIKMFEFQSKLHWFFPKDPISNIPTIGQIMAWRGPGDKPLSEPMMVKLLTYISVTRPQWITQLHIYLCSKKCNHIAFNCKARNMNNKTSPYVNNRFYYDIRQYNVSPANSRHSIC